MSFLNPTPASTTKSLDIGKLSDWLSELSDISGGVSQMISPEVQAQKQTDAQIQAAKDKKTWNIFIGVAVLLIIGFVGWILIKKKK